jgi:hypothetical protein
VLPSTFTNGKNTAIIAAKPPTIVTKEPFLMIDLVLVKKLIVNLHPF